MVLVAVAVEVKVVAEEDKVEVGADIPQEAVAPLEAVMPMEVMEHLVHLVAEMGEVEEGLALVALLVVTVVMVAHLAEGVGLAVQGATVVPRLEVGAVEQEAK